MTQSIVDSSCLDRARISFHRHSSLFQDHGVDRCVTYLLAARSSCIHAMDASNTSRIFNPKPDVAACISKQSSISFPSLPLSLSRLPLFLFLFHSFHFLPLFLFPPFITARHLARPRQPHQRDLFCRSLRCQAKWNSRLCSFCGENGMKN